MDSIRQLLLLFVYFQQVVPVRRLNTRTILTAMIKLVKVEDPVGQAYVTGNQSSGRLVNAQFESSHFSVAPVGLVVSRPISVAWVNRIDDSMWLIRHDSI